MVHSSLRAASCLEPPAPPPRQASSHGIRLGLPQLGLNVDFPLSIPCFFLVFLVSCSPEAVGQREEGEEPPQCVPGRLLGLGQQAPDF